MTSPDELKPLSDEIDIGIRIDRVSFCRASFYRYLYREVGRAYHWVDRLDWTDETIRTHLDRLGLSLWVMYRQGSPAGYYELERHPDGSVEIAYFGLFSEYLGQGLGKRLLWSAAATAWAAGASRVWLHTCTLDDPAALPNYIKRGFKPYKEERYFTSIGPEEILRSAEHPDRENAGFSADLTAS